MNLRRTLALGITALCLATPSISDAANISVEYGVGGTVAFVTLKGKINKGDGTKFKEVVAGLESGVVYLISEGGLTFEGIEISAEVRARNLKAVVPAGKACASSCGVIWLGSTSRYLDKGARVGFHAAWETRHKRVTESGVGNAVLGSYLGSIGLSVDAIYYVTQAPPSSLIWLTETDAARVGIEAKFNAVPNETLQQIAEKADPKAFSRARHASPPIPIPRSKPIEVLMMSAANMKIEATPLPPPLSTEKIFYDRIGPSEESAADHVDAQLPATTVKSPKQIYDRIVGDKEVDGGSETPNIELIDETIVRLTKGDFLLSESDATANPITPPGNDAGLPLPMPPLN
jgi:hypothetical protein